MTIPAVVNGAYQSHRGSNRATSRALSGAAADSRTSGGAERCSRSLRRASAACVRTPSRASSSSPSLDAVPVPIRTVVRPSTRWISEALMSTVRTRSIEVDSTCLLSRPRRSSTRPSAIRKRVV